MFLLQDTPSKETLASFAARYPQLQPAALGSCIAILRTGRELQRVFDRFLSAKGLSQGRFLTLIVLNRTPESPTTPSTLAEKVGVTRATMTGLIDGLTRDGFVDRVPHPTDRRKVHVQLSTSGQQRLEDILPDYYARIASIAAVLSPDEQVQLSALLQKIEGSL